MQMVSHQVMGYDRAITVFSPDGRLLQVEYAKKSVTQGAMALGIVFKDGVLLMADRKMSDKLLVADSVKKIYKIDKHIISTAAGYLSDARVLVKKCRYQAQQHRLTYGEETDIETLMNYIGDLEQAYTQYGGIRPFGISFMVAGVDKKGPSLYVAEPSGTYFKYVAKAIGMGASEANKILEMKCKPGMSADDAKKLSLEIFKKVLKKDFSNNRMEYLFVTTNGTKR